MRSNTQAIILDRLQHALKSRGADLKRMAILEIAAETFGFQDGNAFVAAMKEGRYDPPHAQLVPAGEGHNLVILKDPLAGSIFGIDMASMEPESRRGNFVISPYGSLLALPDTSLITQATDAVPTEPTIEYLIGLDGVELAPEVAAWREYLIDYIDCDVDPITDVSACRMARIDGRLFFAFEAEEEYRDHEQGAFAADAFSRYVEKHGPTFERVGGFMRWVDHKKEGVIEFEAFLPANLAVHADDPDDWHDAVAILFGSKHHAVMATFVPQAWQNDNAIDVDPLGDTDIDITFEVLTMGAKAALSMRDNRDETDALTGAALAPEWIRLWTGPYYVIAKDEVEEYLAKRPGLPDRKGRSDDEWSCENCGETAQDGSGTCVTCGHEDPEYFG